MRFGLFVPQGWRLDLAGIDPSRHWETIRSVAALAESGPFESIWVYDHFHTVPVPTQEATHEAWSIVSALAAVTSRVRLGQMCTCMGYRHPMYLAKTAATVDLISQGRLDVGVGAGWYEHEWNAYGYGFPPVGDRLAMLAEGVEIMRRAWGTGRATLAGEHYQVDGAICRPLPVQDGGPPLWIAGGGERRTLRIAAQHAACTNFDGTPEGFRHKSAVLARHCKDVGRDFDEIVRSANYTVVVGRDGAEVDERIERYRDRYAPFLPEELLGTAVEQLRAGPLVGTPRQLVERLARLQDAGMTYAITYFGEAAHDTSGIELFAEQVVPRLV